MKKHYEKAGSPKRHRGKFTLSWSGQHRYVQTFNELRTMTGHEADGLPVRRRRLTIPTVRNDVHISRNYGRSWKDYTRQRHQWEKR